MHSLQCHSAATMPVAPTLLTHAYPTIHILISTGPSQQGLCHHCWLFLSVSINCSKVKTAWSPVNVRLLKQLAGFSVATDGTYKICTTDRDIYKNAMNSRRQHNTVSITHASVPWYAWTNHLWMCLVYNLSVVTRLSSLASLSWSLFMFVDRPMKAFYVT